MTVSDLTTWAIILAAGIVVLVILGALTQGRFKNTKHRDKFKNKTQVGKHNVGKTKEEKDYRALVKERGLEEANALEPKISPKVTSSLATATRDVRSSDE